MSVSITLTITGAVNDPPHLAFAEHLSALVAREIEAAKNDTPGATATLYGPMEVRTTEQKRRIRSDESYQLTDTGQRVELTAHLNLFGSRQQVHE